MTEKTEEQAQNDFVKDYEKISKKHGLMFVPLAQLKQSMDTGEYTITANFQIAKRPEK